MLRLHALMVMLGLLGMVADVASGQNIRRRALLIGVAAYEKAGFTDLQFPEADVKDLKSIFEAAGFDVTLMLGSLPTNDPLRATRANVAYQLMSLESYRTRQANLRSNVPPGFVARLGELDEQDVVLVALAGHGRQRAENVDGLIKQVPYYCPVDANQSDKTSWISISDLMTQVSSSSGSQNNLILIDACRDNPSRGRGIEGEQVTLTAANLAICFSSSARTEAYEAKPLGHGIFTHFVLQGLKGEAATPKGQVTWDSLVGYVRTAVTEEAPNLVQQEQHPNAISNTKGVSPVLVASVRPRAVEPARVEPNRPMPVPYVDRSLAKNKSGSSTKAPPMNRVGTEQEFTNSIGMKFRRIEAGKFRMGSESGSDDEKPVLEVELTKPFYMGVYEVTQKQWNTVMPNRQSPWKGKIYTTEGDDIAASYISWNDAQEFLKKLNELEASTGRRYRLPTEAEWEYACRAGTKTEYSFGDDASELSRFAWWGGIVGDGNAKQEHYAHRVGLKQPNSWGLFDMHGNVYEWCEDLYDEGFYQHSQRANPVNLKSGSSRVLRGGSWNLHVATFCRSALRNYSDATDRDDYIGFRVVLSVE